jgi:hypothetical protein
MCLTSSAAAWVFGPFKDGEAKERCLAAVSGRSWVADAKVGEFEDHPKGKQLPVTIHTTLSSEFKGEVRALCCVFNDRGAFLGLE